MDVDFSFDFCIFDTNYIYRGTIFLPLSGIFDSKSNLQNILSGLLGIGSSSPDTLRSIQKNPYRK